MCTDHKPTTTDTASDVSGKSTFQPLPDDIAKLGPELLIRNMEFSNKYGRRSRQIDWQAKQRKRQEEKQGEKRGDTWPASRSQAQLDEEEKRALFDTLRGH